MSKVEDKKLRVFRGRNMLKCNDCSCGNMKCEDGARFCSRCGVWRIVLALTLFVIMFKIGYICGAEMQKAEAVDEAYSSSYMSRGSHRGVMSNMMERGITSMDYKSSDSYKSLDNKSGVDSNGCAIKDAMLWSKSATKCVALYQSAIELSDVNGGAQKVSYLMTSNKEKLELYFNGAAVGTIFKNVDGIWTSEDGKMTLSKNTDNKYVLMLGGKVIQAQR